MEALALERAFGSSTLAYGASVLPSVARELSRWRARAQEIPSAPLRRLALAALRKRGNMRGAALFAVLAPRAGRAGAVRALVALQSAYNYLDTLAEQPSADPVGNGRRLHRALLVALDPDAGHEDYYASQSFDERGVAGGDSGDGGYLRELVDTACACVSALPSFALVADPARMAAARIVDFQSLNLGERQGSAAGLERWGREQTPAGSGLCWWETAAAGGSSLGVHVLIGLAADPRLDPGDIAAIERAYWPWIGALHSLLDSLVDVAEDRRDRQRNLLGYYASPAQAAERIVAIALRARAEARGLAHGQRHELIVTAMACHYLSAPEARAPEVRAIASGVAQAAGPLVRPALPLFKATRTAARIGGRLSAGAA